MFKKKIEKLDLGLSKFEVNSLASIFDEDVSGTITVQKFHNTLQNYQVRSDDADPIGDDTQSHEVMDPTTQKLIKVMRARNIGPQELSRLVNPSGSKLIALDDVKNCLKSFGDFQNKDLVAIQNLFNVDGDDRINKNHFLTQIYLAND